MPFLVDGNNLMGLTPGLRRRDQRSRQELVRRISAYQRRRGGKYVVFFDGEPERGPLQQDGAPGWAGISVRFSGHGVTADESIVRFLERAEHPRDYTVISSDRQLVTDCRQLGARHKECVEFGRALESIEGQREGTQRRPVSHQDIEEWLKIFGDE